MKSLVMTTFLLTIFAFANTSLDWQKVSLEEKLASKIKLPLSGMLRGDQYLVEVEVKINDPGPPNFDDINKVGIKVSDIKFDESKGDYIAFSKVGLEVPVVEKYGNDHQQKLKELHRFNESYDIFKNIEKVDVNIWLSDKLSDEVVARVKNLVGNIKYPLGDVKPKVNYQKIDIETLVGSDSNKPSMSLKDWFDWFSRFGNAIGMVLFALLAGFMAMKVLQKWFEFQQQLKQMAEKKEEEKKEELKEDEAAAENAEDAIMAEGILESTSEENFARFLKFMENSKSDTILMIKRWINENTAESTLALKAVAQQLTDEQLVSIFKGLNENEREAWKEGLDEFLPVETVATANKFISEEVMRDMIGPSKIQDIELVDLLLTIRPDVACKFVKEKPEESKVLMNLLTPQFSGKILDLLTEEDALQVIQNSLKFDFSEVKDNFANFKKVLADYRERLKRKPFNAKILQMLPDFNPLKEKLLYNFLAKENMRDEMIKAGKQFFPSELLVKLPKELLKTMMQNYPMAKKVQLLSSLDDQLKDQLMNSFAEVGSASREMLDLEFENLKSDPNAITRIKSKKDDIWKEYVNYAREAIKANQEFSSELEMMVVAWIDELLASNATSQDNVVNIRSKAAA